MFVRRYYFMAFLLINLALCSGFNREKQSHSADPNREKILVKVFEYVLEDWGDFSSGTFSCNPGVKCAWGGADDLTKLGHMAHDWTKSHSSAAIPHFSVAMYSILSLFDKYESAEPQHCQLSTNLTMFNIAEANVRFSWLTDDAYKYYDGYVSTHPNASVQYIDEGAFLDEQTFFPLKDFNSLVKAGAFIASDCHERHDWDLANAHREDVVRDLRTAGFRIDGLGRCLHTDDIPEDGKTLDLTNFYDGSHPKGNMFAKKEVLNNYAFTMAFENSIESGYVTEKPFDALEAGKKQNFICLKF
jgi:hypothetical protein